MNYSIEIFENLVKEKYVRKSEYNALVLYTYTDKCTYEKGWNKYTRVARGLILEKETGKVIAQPLEKFFNLNEMAESEFKNLPNEPYKVTEKVDGSLAIIFHYNNKWNVATKGSFDSEQSDKATQLLKQYDMSKILHQTTLLAEIIYPENKIVVNYGNEEKLVLLAAFNRADGKELSFDTVKSIAAITGMSLVKEYNYTIEEMIALQKTLPKDQEGFVVRFQSGLRVKIKGDEYCRIHKIISQLSPLSFWECMKDGIVNKEYLTQVPEEFKEEFEPIVEELEIQYKAILREVIDSARLLPTLESTPEARKEVGLFLKDNKLVHSKAMFHIILKNKEALDSYVMKQIRPDSNNLRDI